MTGRLGNAVRNQLVEVFGQRKLLKWSVPGAAHFFVFWAFVILGSVYVEAYGALFDDDFAIPVIGHWAILGFAQDFIAVMALVGLVTFAAIRLRNSPERLGRGSRFKGSHLGGAWLVLFMIFNVIWTMFLFRGAASATGNLPYDSGAFVSIALGNLFDGLSHDALEVLEGIGLLLHIGVMLTFLIIVLNSKHLHIFVAPLNVLFKREPIALGAAKPLTSGGQPITLDEIDDLDDDATFGIGRIEDFSWKGMLDFATCTECGRCQSQCPAWNTEKPLSPKLMIMALRDHAFAKAPYILAGEAGRDGVPAAALAEAERPLVGATEGEAWHPTGGGIIDPDVLWSCVTCGACVQQCPVDIEHVDHIVDMRRYQVLVESSFPAELNQLFKGLETKGNPWNMSATARLDWTKGLDFDVPVVGEDLESLESVDWLFWVGCAGAYEDRAKKTTRAVAELLNIAGVSFGVLGNGETCTGDSARRAGNEFVFQGLAQQNIETFKEFKVKKVVSTCAHCFNTLKNEYKQFGIELEVVHHTQLLNRLVREGRLTPVAHGAGAAKRSITYHDPCYIGRHNQVYEPPRELLQVLPGADFVEMERNSERSFCCGAGGARMWMEETIGSRINVNRTTEAVGTGADQIAVGCPFCRVMLSDGLTALQAQGEAREEVEVLDVAQMLLASVKGESATAAPRPRRTARPVRRPPPTPSSPGRDQGRARGRRRHADPRHRHRDRRRRARRQGVRRVLALRHPRPRRVARRSRRRRAVGSLFDTPAPAAARRSRRSRRAASGGSLFDAPAPAPRGQARRAAPAPGMPRAAPVARSSTSPPPAARRPLPPEPPTRPLPESRPPTPPRPPRRPAAPSSTSPPAAPGRGAASRAAPVARRRRSLFDVEPQAAPDPVALSQAATRRVRRAADVPADPETNLDAGDEPAPPATPRGLFDEPADEDEPLTTQRSSTTTPEPTPPRARATGSPRGLFDVDSHRRPETVLTPTRPPSRNRRRPRRRRPTGDTARAEEERQPRPAALAVRPLRTPRQHQRPRRSGFPRGCQALQRPTSVRFTGQPVNPTPRQRATQGSAEGPLVTPRSAGPPGGRARVRPSRWAEAELDGHPEPNGRRQRGSRGEPP